MPPAKARRPGRVSGQRNAARKAVAVVKKIVKDVKTFVNPPTPGLRRGPYVSASDSVGKARKPKSPRGRVAAKASAKGKRGAKSLNDVVVVEKDGLAEAKEAVRAAEERFKKIEERLAKATKRKVPSKPLPPRPKKKAVAVSVSAPVYRNSAGEEAPPLPDRDPEFTVISTVPLRPPRPPPRRSLPSEKRNKSKGISRNSMPTPPPALQLAFDRIRAGRASLPAEPAVIGSVVAHPVDSESSSSDGPAEPDDLSRVSVRDSPYKDPVTGNMVYNWDV